MAHLVLGVGYKQNEYEAVRHMWRQHDIDFHFVRSVEDAARLLRHEIYICVTIFADRIEKTVQVEELHSIQAIPIVLVSESISLPQRIEYLQKSVAEFILNEDQRQEAESHGKDAVQYYLDLPEKGDQPLTAVTTKDICFCLEHRTVDVCGHRIELTPKEFDILSLLITHPQLVYRFELLIDLVWNDECTFCSRKTLINHVSNLRRKLKTQPDMPDYITSVRGVGYKFDAAPNSSGLKHG